MRMSLGPLLVIGVALLLHTQATSGAMVIRKSTMQPVFGFVVNQVGQNIVIRETLPDGKQRETAIPRSDVDELILTVLPERLSALDPALPQGYRDYAEELYEKRRDPEARETALRLYQMAATLAPHELGRSALLGMIALARSPQEEAKFRAAAYMLDPAHDAGVLQPLPALRAPAAGSASATALPDLIRALKAARRGRGNQAKAFFERPGVKEQLAAIPGEITAAEFYAACGPAPLRPEQLEKLLRLEVALEAALAGDAAAGNERSAGEVLWSRAVARGAVASLPSLELDELTEFDPHAHLFRDGRWVRPDSDK